MTGIFNKIKKNFNIIIMPLGALLASVLLKFFIQHGIHYTCTFYKFTGIYCMGCGGTRAMLAFLNGNILLSIHENPAVILLAIFSILYYLEQVFKTFGKAKKLIPRNLLFWVILLILWTIWDIFRNLIPELMPIT